VIKFLNTSSKNLSMEVLKISKISIKNLSKNFGLEENKIKVLKNLNLDLNLEKTTIILGKSGCGKTTLLRLISDLDKDYQGKIIKDDKLKIGIIFQEPRLMPWLNVYDNIKFGLTTNEIFPQKILELIKLVGLENFSKAYPHQLSGGMSQRVALARTLIYDPDLILMDEPFAALDYFTRTAMQDEIIKIKNMTQKSLIFVTHNIDEALNIGEDIIILENGIVKNKYFLDNNYPRDLFSANLIKLKKEILNNFK
jgi:ABC-type nitrate/sulfonate/bicarbonate transport system, ATPase component